MKKINALSESDFMKALFGCFTLAFLFTALILPDRNNMISGLWQIVSQPSKIFTNYFAVGGYSATFLNIGLVSLVCFALYVLLDASVNYISMLAFLLTVGFASWGINILNMWPGVLGVMLHCLVKKERFAASTNAMLFSTGVAPLITELMVRYPQAQWVGFHPSGIVLGVGVGICVGFLLPAGIAHAPTIHKGFDLYSAAVPVGMAAFLLQAIFYKTMGVALPEDNSGQMLLVGSHTIANVFCGTIFGLCVLMALLMGCTPRTYWKLLRDHTCGSFSATYGNAAFLMNVGVFGLFILAYYNLVGATFNGVTFGLIFCMLACCNAGSTPLSVFPIILGYIAASHRFQFFSERAGGSFAGTINAQSILVGLCFANGLSPVSRRYGWLYGFIAGIMHYTLVTSVPMLHGGYCLYNGGFTAALVCILLVPCLDHFARDRDQRREHRAAKKAKQKTPDTE